MRRKFSLSSLPASKPSLPMAPIWAGTCRSCIWQGHASVTALLGSASSPRAGKARDLRMLAPMTVAGVQITPDERRRDESSGTLLLLKLSPR